MEGSIALDMRLFFLFPSMLMSVSSATSRIRIRLHRADTFLRICSVELPYITLVSFRLVIRSTLVAMRFDATDKLHQISSRSGRASVTDGSHSVF